MADILKHYLSERRFEWQGREWTIPLQQHKIFMLCHRFHGHWVPPERFERVLWPAQSPDDWRAVLAVGVSQLRKSLKGTSCELENMSDSHSNGIGYRLVGLIDTQSPTASVCPLCGTVAATV